MDEMSINLSPGVRECPPYDGEDECEKPRPDVLSGRLQRKILREDHCGKVIRVEGHHGRCRGRAV